MTFHTERTNFWVACMTGMLFFFGMSISALCNGNVIGYNQSEVDGAGTTDMQHLIASVQRSYPNPTSYKHEMRITTRQQRVQSADVPWPAHIQARVDSYKGTLTTIIRKCDGKVLTIKGEEQVYNEPDQILTRNIMLVHASEWALRAAPMTEKITMEEPVLIKETVSQNEFVAPNLGSFLDGYIFDESRTTMHEILQAYEKDLVITDSNMIDGVLCHRVYLCSERGDFSFLIRESDGIIIRAEATITHGQLWKSDGPLPQHVVNDPQVILEKVHIVIDDIKVGTFENRTMPISGRRLSEYHYRDMGVLATQVNVNRNSINLNPNYLSHELTLNEIPEGKELLNESSPGIVYVWADGRPQKVAKLSPELKRKLRKIAVENQIAQASPVSGWVWFRRVLVIGGSALAFIAAMIWVKRRQATGQG